MRHPLRLSSAAIALLAATAAAPAMAQTIEETLSNAYIQSTQLGVSRAQQRATDEQVPQALSNWRPTITLNGGITRTHTGTDPQPYEPDSIFSTKTHKVIGTYGYDTQKTASVQVIQNIYRGGRTDAQVSQATNAVKAGQAQLKATEQAVLLSAAQYYLDVVRDQSTVDLNASNESVLKRQLDAETDRLRVGEVTRTDVALAQASYQQARAQHTTAIGTLKTDQAAYQRVVGQAPGKLIQPVFKYELPATLEDAVAEAEENNPSVVAAEFIERAARDGVDLAQGARLPTIQLVGTFERLYPGGNSNSQSIASASTDGAGTNLGRISHIDTGSVAAQISWPLYTGGLASSQVREAKQTANQNLIAIEDAKRVARQTAISAWQQLKTAQANIEALTAQVEAAAIGAEGTRQQALVGTATVLDSLTAEQQLLQAQVNLVGAQHDALVDSYTLLSAVGRLTARDMSLPVAIYDPQVNADRVRDKWFGTGID
jgi:outer membrane protein/adhesin transport system outer membrane protein